MTAKIPSPDKDTDYFELVGGALQGDTLAPCLFIIALTYAISTANEQETGKIL